MSTVARTHHLLVGAYTDRPGGADGVTAFAYDASTGALDEPVAAVAVPDPSYLALHPRGRVVYAVNETTTFQGSDTGGVTALAVGDGDLDLRPLGDASSGGTEPCHLSVDPTGRVLLVANYGDGSVAVLPLGPDGRVDPPVDVVRHAGAGPHPERQSGPHVHMVVTDPLTGLVLAADLGADEVAAYELVGAPVGVRLRRRPDRTLRAAPGSGPRHLAFTPTARHLLVVHELDNTVVVHRRTDNGGFVPVNRVSTLPEGFAGDNRTSAIRVAPSGRFAYAGNRGHDSVMILRVDEATGALTPVAHEPTRGGEPRDLALDPTGRHLLVADQDADLIVTFRVDAGTGLLTHVGETATPKPTCLVLTR